jgi:hypothetical protein
VTLASPGNVLLLSIPGTVVVIALQFEDLLLQILIQSALVSLGTYTFEGHFFQRKFVEDRGSRLLNDRQSDRCFQRYSPGRVVFRLLKLTVDQFNVI